MDVIAQFLSIGAIASIGYFLGFLFLEFASLRDGDICVPRSRKERYKLRAFSFADYLFGILLVALMIKGDGAKEYTTAVLGAIIGSYILRGLAIGGGKRLHSWLVANRFITHVKNLTIFGWLAVSGYLLSLSVGEAQRTIAYLVSLYLFIGSIQVIAMVAENPMHIGITMLMKNKKVISNRLLVEETEDYFVVYAGNRSNLLISKSEVECARVWIVDDRGSLGGEEDHVLYFS